MAYHYSSFIPTLQPIPQYYCCSFFFVSQLCWTHLFTYLFVLLLLLFLFIDNKIYICICDCVLLKHTRTHSYIVTCNSVVYNYCYVLYDSHILTGGVILYVVRFAPFRWKQQESDFSKGGQHQQQQESCNHWNTITTTHGHHP